MSDGNVVRKDWLRPGGADVGLQGAEPGVDVVGAVLHVRRFPVCGKKGTKTCPSHSQQVHHPNMNRVFTPDFQDEGTDGRVLRDRVPRPEGDDHPARAQIRP